MGKFIPHATAEQKKAMAIARGALPVGGGVWVEVHGVKGVQEVLDRFEKKRAKKILQQATQASGKYLKPKVKAAAPKYKRLQKSIATGRAKRGRPAAIVVAKPRVAFYRHFVMLGTKPGTRTAPKRPGKGKFRGRYSEIHHPGVRPNPFIARTAQQNERGAVEAAEQVIEAALEE